ncbi:MAG: metallophosphoesterase, partial [Marinirhabdus sp.]|nr:metallophosphoesterase [Marinirhabdus sp.]
MLHSLPKISYKHGLILLIFYICYACSSYKEQRSEQLSEITKSSETPTHTFYIAGGLGTSEPITNKPILQTLEQELAEAKKNSTLIFPGDYTSENLDNEAINKVLLQKHLDLVKGFKGKTYFVPGDHEWTSANTDEIEWVEDYIKDNELKRIEVEPNNVCPLEYRKISDEIDLILIDSQWYISNWDRIEGMNRKCPDIKTQRRFIEELEGMIKDARGKNLVIAMHHPIFSNGAYANNYWGGMNPKKVFFQRYQELAVQVSALVQDLDRVTILSGHEESLQYVTSENKMHQVISGSLGSTSKTNREKGRLTTVGGQLKYEGQYTHGEEGYSVVEFYADGSSRVTFVTIDGRTTFNMAPALPEEELDSSQPSFNSETVQVPVVSDQSKLEKSGFYKFLWGDRFRKYYGIPVTVQNVNLKEYKGGLTVKEKGGGHQTYSAKLKDADGAEYAIRGLEKDAFKFLKFKVKGITFEPEEYKGTFAEMVVYDFFTTSHPFMQSVIDPMAKEIDVNHADIQLAYVPKQPNLDALGREYGDALYWLEERPDDGQEDYPGYARANPGGGETVTFESMTDVLEKLREDEKYSVDQRTWIRSRLFDMLIGDWDRHQDQWRFAEYEIDDDTTRFIPIPRDRDAAFSRFDGLMMPLIKMALPNTRFWQSYREEIRDIKWYNGEGNNLDRALMTKYGKEAWIEEAKYIQENITDAEIDRAWENLPPEVQDETSEFLKKSFKTRLSDLQQY